MKPDLSGHIGHYGVIKVGYFVVEKKKNQNYTTIRISIKFVYFLGYLLISNFFAWILDLSLDAIKKAGWHFRICKQKFSSPYRFWDMIFLSFLTLLNKKRFCQKGKVTNWILENKSGPLYMVLNRQLLVSKLF